MPMIKCANPQCGEEFFPRAPKQKYCSKECWYSHYNNRPLYKAKAKARTKCTICGKEFIQRTVNQKYCSTTCSLAAENARHKNSKHAPKTKPKPAKTFEQWAREAAECNLDYGTYRGLIQLGKTYEELKATADTRHLQAHSSIKRKRSD